METVLNFIGGIFGYVLEWLYELTSNYGVAILLFTIFTRLILFPLTISQQKSSSKMARLRPKMDELKQKYGNNKEKYNEELQKLYEKEGISSMGGCLPLLIQLPIITGLFSAMRMPLSLVLHQPKELILSLAERVGVETAKNSYYQIDLITKLKENCSDSVFSGLGFSEQGIDKIQNMVQGGAFNFLGIDLLQTPKFFGNLAFILTVTVVIAQFLSMFVTQKYITPMQQTPGCNPIFMNIALTLMIGGFSLSMPAAISLYYTMTSILSPVQSYFVNRYYNAARLEALAEAKRIARLKQDEAVISDYVEKIKGKQSFMPDYSYTENTQKSGAEKRKKKK